jgi:hypothetical protein
MQEAHCLLHLDFFIMKKVFIVFFIFFTSHQAYCQLDLIGSFNSVHIGRNLDLTLKKDIGKHAVLFGLKYNLNKLVTDNQNNVFKKRFYATSLEEHFGFSIGYQYHIKLRRSSLSPFLFYDFQFTNSHTRNRMFLPYCYDTSGVVLFKEHLEYFGPTIALEHNLGIGLTIDIFKRLYLYQKIGGGIVDFFNVDARMLGGSHWEFESILSVGVGYRLCAGQNEHLRIMRE